MTKMIKALNRTETKKNCFTCRKRKLLSEFGVSLNPCSLTGFMSSCKTCEFEATVRKVAINTIADEKRAERKVIKDLKKKIAPVLAIEKKYNRAIQDFIRIFEEKQGLEFARWANDEFGSIAFFVNIVSYTGVDHAFDFTDIKWDLLNNKPKGSIIEYYDWEADEETISYKDWWEVYK